MTVRSIHPTEGTRFRIIAVRSDKSPPYEIEVDACPPGVVIPELWRDVFARQIRRELLLLGVSVDMPGRDRIVRQCLANRALQDAVIGKKGAWRRGSMSEAECLTKIQDWGVVLKGHTTTTVGPVASDSTLSVTPKSTVADYADAIENYPIDTPETPAQSTPDADPSAPAAAPEAETTGSGWLKWLLSIVAIGSLASGIYFFSHDQTDISTVKVSIPDEALKTEVHVKLISIWSNCLKTNNDLTLEEAMGVSNFQEQREDFEQHVEYLSSQHQKGQPIPFGIARKYLLSNMERYNKLCKCTTTLNCND